MSNVDPSPGGHRPPRTFGQPPQVPDFAPPTGEPTPAPLPRRRTDPTSVMIIVLVVIMVASLVVIPIASPALERFLDQRRDTSPPSTSPGPTAPLDPGGPEEGGSGAGDPYYPNYGSSGFNALDYTIKLDWSPTDQMLTGSSTIEARADHKLESFYLDLVLPVTGATVNGEDAEVTREGYYDIRITPAEPIKAGSTFTATVQYAGNPSTVKLGNQSPWQLSEDEVIVTGEPESAAWWYAANDHPSDPARFDVTVRVPAGWEAISVGRLVSDDIADEERFDTWRWELDEPANTYQTFVAIGQYELRTGSAGGRPYSYAVSEQLDDQARQRAFESLEATPEVIAELEEFAGPYPYDEIGGIVPAHRLWFAGLEAATRPIYVAEPFLENSSRLLIHELAHMWYGDKVTMEQWNDIFINEAYASYAEWVLTERRGGRTAQQQLERSYDRLQGEDDFWAIPMHNPGRDHLFDTVYSRGPMTMHALRNVIGDDAFFLLARDWAEQSGPHSLEDWMDAAQDSTAIDLQPFFRAWIYGTEAPARTTQNGLS